MAMWRWVTSPGRWRRLIRGGVAHSSGWPAENEIVRHTHHPVVLPLALLLAGAGTVASTAPVGAAIASVHRASAVTGRLDLAGIAFSYPRLNAAAWILLGLALIGVSAIAVAMRAGLRQHRAYRRFLAGLDV